LSLESMGITRPGETPRLLSTGELDPGGRVVVNADGGLKCMGFPGGASGIYQVVSMVMQLAGEKPFEAMRGLEYGVVQDMGGFDLLSSVVVMRRVS
jgi:acetyl-CoA C-acetyltransferase